MLGSSLLGAGRLDEACETLTEAKNLLDALGDARNGGSIRYKLGRAHRLRKEYDLAEKYLDEADKLLADLPRARGLMHAHKALLYVDMNRPAEALEQARHGMAILERLGRIGSDEILVRYAYIESLSLAGLHEEAGAQITVAKERVSFMANRLSDESFRESFLNNIEENRRVLAMQAPSPVERQ